MKILYYIHNLGVGGAEMVVTNYLIALKERGHIVSLVVNDEKASFLTQRLTDQNIRIISLRSGFSKNILIGKFQRGILKYSHYYRKKWKRIFEEEDPDVFHIHTSTHFLKQINFPSDRMVYTFHGDVPRYIELHGKKNYKIIQEFAQNGMTFYSLSSEMSQDIRAYFNTNKIEYIPNGVNILEIRRKKYSREAFLNEWGIPMDAYVLGQVGRFHPVKNQMRTIAIFNELLKQKGNSYLIFVGDGHADYLQNVKQRVDELELKDRVLFLGVRRDATQVMSVLDALVLPSVAESFSLVLVEAQAHGIRIVASDTVPEEVVCNANCFRLALHETDEKWVRYLLGDFVEEKNKSIENFSMGKVIDRMVQCYEKIIRK